MPEIDTATQTDLDFKQIAEWLKTAKITDVTLDREKGVLEITYAAWAETLTISAIIQDGVPRLDVFLYSPYNNGGIVLNGTLA